MDILAFNSFHLRQKLGFPGGARDKEPFVNAGDIREAGSSPGQEDPLEEGTATTPVFLPGESSWTEESGGLESIAPQKKIRHHWRYLPDKAEMAFFILHLHFPGLVIF